MREIEKGFWDNAEEKIWNEVAEKEEKLTGKTRVKKTAPVNKQTPANMETAEQKTKTISTSARNKTEESKKTTLSVTMPQSIFNNIKSMSIEQNISMSKLVLNWLNENRRKKYSENIIRSSRKHNDRATSKNKLAVFTISLTEHEKKEFKLLAMKQNKTVSELIRVWYWETKK